MTSDKREAARPLFFLSAGIIIKDEGRYIEEWIAYHHLIGFDHIFVFDNNSSDDIRDILRPYINRGLVTYVFWPMFPGQSDAYDYACRLTAGRTEWIAFIDIDEFVAPRPGLDLRRYLAENDADQILVRWLMFGHSRHLERQDGLTTEAFTFRAKGPSHNVKSFVRPQKVAGALPHYSRLQEGGVTRDAAGRLAREDWKLTEPVAPDEAMVLHHYYTRSWAEFVHKMTRGDVQMNLPKDMGSYERWDLPHEDRSLAAFAPRLQAFIADMRAAPESPIRYGTRSTPENAGSTQPFSLACRVAMDRFIQRFPDMLKLERGARGAAAQFLSGADDTDVRQAWLEETARFAEQIKARRIADVAGPADVTEDRPLLIDLPETGTRGFVYLAYRFRVEGTAHPELRLTGQIRETTHAPRERMRRMRDTTSLGHLLVGDAATLPKSLSIKVRPGEGTLTVESAAVMLIY